MPLLRPGQDSVCQRVERPVRHGRDRVRQHADVAGRQHQDDGKGARRCHSPHHARLQGQATTTRLRLLVFGLCTFCLFCSHFFSGLAYVSLPLSHSFFSFFLSLALVLD